MPLIVLGNLLWILLVALGISLIWVGWRARSAAEAVLGTCLITMGSGAALLIIAFKARILPLGAVAITLIGVGTMALPAFTYLVFRRGEPLVRLFAAALALLTLAGSAHQIQRIFATTAGEVQPSVLFLLARLFTTGWAAVEAFRFWRLYVRRRVLGLADPVIANRFLLYAIWTGALALMPIGTLAVTLAGNTLGIAWKTMVMVPTRLLAVVVGVTMVLTFLPPRWYIRWIEARHATGGTP